jgi:hypothetical protein
MKRKWLACCISAVLLAAVFAWAAATKPFGRPSPNPSALDRFLPRGAALVLEAKDFSSLLDEWNSSPVKQQWLKSDDFEVFSRSRVLLRLAEAQQQFAAAGGVPPDMRFLSQAAGKESTLGFYDIGKLEFLYITRLPSVAAMQSALWQARTKFESRNAAGTPFFVHADAQSGRVVAFALAGDYLLLATREDLLASALELVAGNKGPNVTEEDWYAQAVSSAADPGDLRMVLNMEKIVAAPHFRSYWIQSNVKEMQHYSAAISDLHRAGSVYREERVLLRKPVVASADPVKPDSAQRASTPEGAQAVADLLRLVPDDAGVYRAAANPAAGLAENDPLALLQAKILSPHTSSGRASDLAPAVSLTGGQVGSSADFETHIDQPPAVRAATEEDSAALRKAFEAANIQATLVVESTHVDAETSFVEIRTAVAFAAASDWNADSIRAALAGAVAQPNTTQQLGASWKNAGKAPNDYMELDGLLPLRIAIRGKILIASNSAETIAAILPRLKPRATAPPVTFAAGFRHSAEQQNFIHLTSDLDRTSPADSEVDDAITPSSKEVAAVQSSYVPGDASSPSFNLVRANQQISPWPPDLTSREPQFFSGNLASLSRVLSVLDSESVVVRDSPAKTFQTVTYRWK